MLDDLNPKSESKKDHQDHIPQNVWDSCVKLDQFMQNPDYQERAMDFLDKLDKLGSSGEIALVVVEILQMDSTHQNKANLGQKSPEKTREAELEEEREAYEKLNQRYEEAMSETSLDTDVLEGIAIGYNKIRDYADSAAKAQEIWNLIDKFEKIVSDIFD